MAVETKTDTACPNDEELRRLVRGHLNEDRQACLCDHLGGCPECQGRLEEIASDGDKLFTGCMKELKRPPVPKESAYWSAISQVEVSITGTHVDNEGDTLPPHSADRNLDFLEPTKTAGRIGKIGPFEVIEEVGRGGMGVVLRAVDASLKREVAVKVLDPGLSKQKVARERFCREAQAAAKVAHENIVAVHQVGGEAAGVPYIVMQLVKGQTLESRLKIAGKLSVPEAVQVGIQAAAGLAAAHEHSLIHRDIKPANILIEDGTNKVKLTDFGLARAEEDAKLTRTGFVAGTPLYMAPEQARGETVDMRSDLFSLGSVLYESLTGKPAFDAKTPLMVLRRLTDEEHEPLHKVVPEVPDWLEDIIDKLLEKDPKNRYQTALELESDLKAKWECIKPLSMDQVEACPIRPSRMVRGLMRNRSQRKLIGTLAAVFLMGVGLGALGAWSAIPRGTAAVPAPSDLGPKEELMTERLGGPVWSLASTPDGRKIVAGLENGDVVIWDILNGGAIQTTHVHNGPVWSVGAAEDAHKIVSSSDDGKVYRRDQINGQVEATIELDQSIRSAAIIERNDATKVLTGDRMGNVKLWDLKNTKQSERVFPHKGVINAVAFANKHPFIASASSNMSAVIWSLNEDKRIPLNGHKGPVYSIAFSPEDDLLATASWDNSVILWDTESGQRKSSIPEAHSEGIWGIAFSCCGKILATAGQDGLVKIWDIDKLPPEGGPEKPAPFITLARHNGTVHAVHFTADGKHLVTGGRDGTIRLWKLEKPKK
jgi:eukaryotic-like serine/threonine-protein kinase